MKTLVIINEPFNEMMLGRNTTLSYILAAVERGDDVYIYNTDPNGALPGEEVKAIHLNLENAKALVEKYKKENDKIKESTKDRITVKAFCEREAISLPTTEVKLSDIEYVIQRLEPMKAPFPPEGKTSVTDFLTALRAKFPPHFAFNCPDECMGDKDLPLYINAALGKEKEIATPTRISFLHDQTISEHIAEMCNRYQEFFPEINKRKIVLKPDDSAQALGVFALELDKDGIDLKTLKSMTLEQLCSTQTYKLKENLSKDDMDEITTILCYTQYFRATQKNLSEQQSKELLAKQISEIKKETIEEGADALYGKKILIQPFLEGVRKGDIRINLVKDADGNFVVGGGVFRNSASHDENNFTTCLTTGGSVPRRLEDCMSWEEMESLSDNLTLILNILNNDEKLRHQYRNIMEIGCDFLLVGNDKDVLLGEANHHCPALIPFSEAIKGRFNQETATYKDDNSGLGKTGHTIRAQYQLQESRKAQLQKSVPGNDVFNPKLGAERDLGTAVSM